MLTISESTGTPNMIDSHNLCVSSGSQSRHGRHVSSGPQVVGSSLQSRTSWRPSNVILGLTRNVIPIASTSLLILLIVSVAAVLQGVEAKGGRGGFGGMSRGGIFNKGGVNRVKVNKGPGFGTGLATGVASGVGIGSLLGMAASNNHHNPGYGYGYGPGPGYGTGYFGNGGYWGPGAGGALFGLLAICGVCLSPCLIYFLIKCCQDTISGQRNTLSGGGGGGNPFSGFRMPGGLGGSGGGGRGASFGFSGAENGQVGGQQRSDSNPPPYTASAPPPYPTQDGGKSAPPPPYPTQNGSVPMPQPTSPYPTAPSAV